MDTAGKRPWNTASFWLVVFAWALRHKTLSSLLLLLAAFGYLGLTLERLCSDDLRRLQARHVRDLDALQLAIHAAIGMWGWRRLRCAMSSVGSPFGLTANGSSAGGPSVIGALSRSK